MDESPSAAASGGPDRSKIMRSLAGSLVLNALIPYLVYRFAEPHYPKGSIVPLLYSTVFPAFGLAYSLARKGAADAIAIIALIELTVTIAVTLVAKDVGWALIARSMQAALTGLVFMGTVLVGRPLIYYIARQFAVAGGPAGAARFEMAHKLDKGRTFAFATTIWACALFAVSGISLSIAITQPPATYILLAPIVSTVIEIPLIWWSIRFSVGRLMRYRAAVVQNSP